MHFIYKVILINAFVNVNVQFFSEIHAITHGTVEAYGSLFKRYSTFLVTTSFCLSMCDLFCYHQALELNLIQIQGRILDLAEHLRWSVLGK